MLDFLPKLHGFPRSLLFLIEDPSGDFAPGNIININEDVTKWVGNTVDGTEIYNPKAPRGSKSYLAPGATIPFFLAFQA